MYELVAKTDQLSDHFDSKLSRESVAISPSLVTNLPSG